MCAFGCVCCGGLLVIGFSVGLFLGAPVFVGVSDFVFSMESLILAQDERWRCA